MGTRMKYLCWLARMDCNWAKSYFFVCIIIDKMGIQGAGHSLWTENHVLQTVVETKASQESERGLVECDAGWIRK